MRLLFNRFVSFQAARAREENAAKKKWEKFVEQIDLERLSNEQIKVLINNLDDRKQWAALHYAVDANNTYVFDQLTAPGKRFRSSIHSSLLLIILSRVRFYP